jgi:hypothetical protein
VDATAVINSGLKVVRIDDRNVRIYGYSFAELEDALTPNFSGDVVFSVLADAIRTPGGTLSVIKSTEVGIAKVTSANLEMFSGVADLAGSGTRFTVTLEGNAFITSGLDLDYGVIVASGLTNSGTNLLNYETTLSSGIRLLIGTNRVLSGSGLTLHAVNAVASDLGQTSITFEIRGTFTPNVIADAAELGIVIDSELLLLSSTDITVLTGPKAVSITTNPKLTIAFVEDN